MIKRELIIFTIVGMTTVLIDFLTYHFLIYLKFSSIGFAKGVAFLTGMLFAYIANRLWTFNYNNIVSGSIYRFFFLYLMTLSINIIANNIMLKLLNSNSKSIFLSFLFATTSSSILNFLGLKFFVFNKSTLKQNTVVDII